MRRIVREQLVEAHRRKVQRYKEEEKAAEKAAEKEGMTGEKATAAVRAHLDARWPTTTRSCTCSRTSQGAAVTASTLFSFDTLEEHVPVDYLYTLGLRDHAARIAELGQRIPQGAAFSSA